MKICPYCAEEIKDDAVKCRFCGEWLAKETEHKQSDILADKSSSGTNDCTEKEPNLDNEKIIQLTELYMNMPARKFREIRDSYVPEDFTPEARKALSDVFSVRQAEIAALAQLCPRCMLENLPSAKVCDCGYDFSKEGDISSDAQISLKVHPWRRYFGRMCDYALSGIVFAIVGIVVWPALLGYSSLLQGLIAVFLWIFVESFFLSSWGFTPGKFLLSTKVEKIDGRKLSYAEALYRSYLVWLKGVGCGIPLVSLITAYISHSKLQNDGISSWDRECNSTVTHSRISPIRVSVLILIIFLTFYIGYIADIP